MGSSVSRVAITAAIANYLNGAGVTYLANCYSYPAKFTPEGEFFEGEDPGTDSGAMIFLRLGRESSERIELRGAPAGGKMRTYSLTMNILFRSTKPLSQDAGLDNDTFLDSLITAIEASKTAGTSDGTVFSWGEGGISGGRDLELETFYPHSINKQVTQVNSTLVVQVLHQTT